ncbi:hypothetical protein H6F77_15080 [Microcoleus sp. FACHB-831]|uniref:hypothetical protein n=1 Tax=Microcoleus sp. FACHB-831 TaxID=2692827 RepID=UPI00168A0B47|nr:hypothetical protein [Microcoleus sp. FACHB-831]MBD1922398.1 hypothetical protein [Microcoleus sp. FACHB-831]
MSLCPCCSHTLVRQASVRRVYWFCIHCHQEMPALETILKAELSLRRQPALVKK